MGRRAQATEDLKRAIKSGSGLDAKAALLRGADPNAEDRSGMTALMMAAAADNEELLEIALERGAETDSKRDYDGWSALHYAAINGADACLARLIGAGADAGAKTKGCETALHFAAGNGEEGCVRALLSAGADWSMRDIRGDTAEDAARRVGELLCAEAIAERREAAREREDLEGAAMPGKRAAQARGI